MTPMIVLTHSGHTYRRTGGQWVDSRNHCFVSAASGQRLDAVAREDAALWEQCLQQDARDRRINSGPSSMTGHGLTAGFFDDGRRLRLTLDIAKGWRRTKRSWRFGARQVVDLLGGWTLSCTVTVVDDGQYGPQFEQELDPEFEFWTNEAEASAIPSFPQSDDTEGEIAFRQDGTQATFEIPVFSEAPGRKLTRSLPWRYVDGRFEFSDYRGGSDVPPQMSSV